MTQKDKILAIAAKEVGYKQAANGSNKFGLWYGADKVAWCAMFLSWCAAQAGIGADIVPKFSYCPAGVAFFKKQDRFRAAKGYAPQPGDIVFYDFNGNGTADHVGLVIGYSGGKINVIEGNTSAVNQANGGAVERKQRSATSGVLGYGIPKYEEEDGVKTQQITVDMNGQETKLTSIVYNEENYVRLRDLADADKGDNLTVDWNVGKKKVSITTK